VGGFNSHPLPPNKAFSALSNPVKFSVILCAGDFCPLIAPATQIIGFKSIMPQAVPTTQIDDRMLEKE
jgi:hypothetical protein